MDVNKSHVRRVDPQIVGKVHEGLVVVHTCEFPLRGQKMKLVQTRERNGGRWLLDRCRKEASSD